MIGTSDVGNKPNIRDIKSSSARAGKDHVINARSGIKAIANMAFAGSIDASRPNRIERPIEKKKAVYSFGLVFSDNKLRSPVSLSLIARTVC